MRTIAAAVLAALTAPAYAGVGHTVVSLDLERGATLQLDGATSVQGAGIRFGYGIDLPLLELVPEGRVMLYEEPNARYGTAELGGRIMFLELLEPGLFGRVVAPFGGGGPGLGFTAGGLLDFTAIPALDIGLHAGMVAGVKGTSWLGGGHLTVNF